GANTNNKQAVTARDLSGFVRVVGGQQQHGWMSLDGVWFVSNLPAMPAPVSPNANSASSAPPATSGSSALTNSSSPSRSASVSRSRVGSLSPSSSRSASPSPSPSTPPLPPVLRVPLRIPPYWANPLPGYRQAAAVVIRERSPVIMCALTGVISSA